MRLLFCSPRRVLISLSSNNLFSPPSLKTRILLQCLNAYSSVSGRKSKWNSTSDLIITHPTLLIMESCNSMFELKQIQAQMTRTGLMMHVFPVSRVLSFCALSENGDVNHARLIFNQIPGPNTYIWNTMIRGHCNAKIPNWAFLFFRRMVQEQVEMDKRTFVFALKACEQFPEVVLGEELHCRACKAGFESDLLVRNGLMHMYVATGYLVAARFLFDTSFLRDVVSWTTMIDGYAQRNIVTEALKLFNLMLSSGIEPNEVTMIAVVSACSQTGDLSLGRSIHDYMEKRNVKCSINLVNALVDMYVKCGCLFTAREIFDGMEMKDVFSWTSMINGYAKHGNLKSARQLFDEMPERNVVSWNAMIAGYSQNNQPKLALELFSEMERACVVPIEATLVSVLSACAQSGCLDLGRWIHHYYIKQKRNRLSVILGNALIDMYAKCGSIDSAAKVFGEMTHKDLVSWNSMIVGFAVHGHAGKAVSLFELMKSEGLEPDDITFVGVLSACSHGGLIFEGQRYFRNMSRVFGLEPKLEHYACMIDLLGRVGRLEEVVEMINGMPMEPDEAVWGALLNACRMHGNVKLGKLAAGKLLRLDPEDSGIYMLLADICATGKRWDDVRMVRSMMRSRGVKKTPGCSSIEVDGKSHEFLVADRSHFRSEEIYKVLEEVFLLSKLEDYVQRTSQLMELDEGNAAVLQNL